MFKLLSLIGVASCETEHQTISQANGLSLEYWTSMDGVAPGVTTLHGKLGLEATEGTWESTGSLRVCLEIGVPATAMRKREQLIFFGDMQTLRFDNVLVG